MLQELVVDMECFFSSFLMLVLLFMIRRICGMALLLESVVGSLRKQFDKLQILQQRKALQKTEIHVCMHEKPKKNCLLTLQVPPCSAKAQLHSQFLQLSPRIVAIGSIVWLFLRPWTPEALKKCSIRLKCLINVRNGIFGSINFSTQLLVCFH